MQVSSEDEFFAKVTKHEGTGAIYRPMCIHEFSYTRHAALKTNALEKGLAWMHVLLLLSHQSVRDSNTLACRADRGRLDGKVV